jgi:hypothetical protein
VGLISEKCLLFGWYLWGVVDECVGIGGFSFFVVKVVF